MVSKNSMLANQYILDVSIDSSIISPHLPGQHDIECIEVILFSVFHFKRKIIIVQLSRACGEEFFR